MITGHLDSRVTNLLDYTSDAPGADDDASGVACVLELARVFAQHQFPGTIIFATVAGEEEGLFGSTFMAQQMAAAGNDVQGMFSNDIIGTGDAHDGTPPNPFTVRMFLEGIPTNATSSDISLMQSVGGENDGKSRQLGRFVAEVAPFWLTGMNVELIWRRDRYLRGTDSLSFQGQGYPAARITEPRENFNHEHQNTQVVNGVQLGDLIQYVDFNFVARVAKVNAAALWALASSPSTPKGVLIHVAPPVNFAGTNLTPLTWNANPEMQSARLRGGAAADHGAGLDPGDPGRQRHLGDAQHRQGQRAVRRARRGPELQPQPGRLPTDGDHVRRLRRGRRARAPRQAGRACSRSKSRSAYSRCCHSSLRMACRQRRTGKLSGSG